MKRSRENIHHMHRDAWVRHIRKMLHDPENNRLSRYSNGPENGDRVPRGISRWERQLQG